MNRQLNEDLLRKTKFIFTGGVTAIGGIIQLKVLQELGWSENAAYVCQLLTMLELNFLLSHLLTWRGVPGNITEKWIWFHIGRAVTIGLSILVNPILTIVMPDWLAYFSLIAAALGINFWFGDKIVFKRPNAGHTTNANIVTSLGQD